MNITVYGAASDSIADIYKQAGEELGEELARRGHNLIFGGGASGMMGATARGASKGGGHITCIAPSFFNIDGVLYPECDEYIFTETMRERKQKLEELSDCFIVSPGGVGTFDEFFEVLTMRNLGRHGKPIDLLDYEGYWRPAAELIRNAVEKGFAAPSAAELFGVFDRAEECLDYLEREAGQ